MLMLGQRRLVNQAKQGNLEAITTLLARSLSRHHVGVTVQLHADCLEVYLTSAKPLNQALVVKAIWQDLQRLQIAQVTRVSIQGLTLYQPDLAWQETRYLALVPASSLGNGSQLSVAPSSESTVDQTGFDQSPDQLLEQPPDQTTGQAAADLLQRYAAGERQFIGINLREANLAAARLGLANFQQANLTWANLQAASLNHTDLRNAKLTCAQLQHANLQSADLRGANLQGAQLCGANLSWTRLSGANLTGADLTDANLKEAELNWVVMPDGTVLD